MKVDTIKKSATVSPIFDNRPINKQCLSGLISKHLSESCLSVLNQSHLKIVNRILENMRANIEENREEHRRLLKFFLKQKAQV